MSTKAVACPHCGAPRIRAKGLPWMWITIAAVIGLVWLAFPAPPWAVNTPTSAAQVAQATPEPKKCSVGAIKIKSMQAKFVDRCRQSECFQMQGVAVLTNGCAEPVGVQLKIVALDAAGRPVASNDFWPASISNIPPGDYTFSLDSSFQHDRRIKSFTLEPIDVKRWQDRAR